MYKFNSREIPLNNSYDVIVIGGGPAGCAAATSAAREGAKTLLIEASGMLGGMATKGLVEAWTPYSDGIRIIYGGLSRRAMEETRAQMPHISPSMVDWVRIDFEVLKTVYDKMVTESGADVMFHSFVCAVDMKDDRNVDAVIVANKSGLTAYKAKVYIDCSGDADIAAWAGNEMANGNGEDDVQPSTHCFIITNINEEAYNKGESLYGGNPKSAIHDIVADDEFTIPDTHLCVGLIGPGTLGFNAGHIWDVDPTDPESVSKGILRGRELAREFFLALKKYRPDVFADAYLVETAPTVGSRESRRIIGDYIFTTDDYFARKSFPDEIGRNNYFIDIHKSTEELKTMKGHSDDRFERYKSGESHGIPYRCLCPRDLDNVLVAGRTISTDRITQGSTRVMPCCLVEGEAAGMAAAFCAADDKVNIHNVDTQKLRYRLIQEGAYLPRLDTDTF